MEIISLLSAKVDEKMAELIRLENRHHDNSKMAVEIKKLASKYKSLEKKIKAIKKKDNDISKKVADAMKATKFDLDESMHSFQSASVRDNRLSFFMILVGWR